MWLQLAVVLDATLQTSREPSRKFLFYECLRQASTLRAWRTRVMLRASSLQTQEQQQAEAAARRRGGVMAAARVHARHRSAPGGAAAAGRGTGEEGDLGTSVGLPTAAATAFRNLERVLECMNQAQAGDTGAGFASSLRVAQARVNEAEPWRVMQRCDRRVDVVAVGGAHPDSNDARQERRVFQSVIRGVVEGVRWRLGVNSLLATASSASSGAVRPSA